MSNRTNYNRMIIKDVNVFKLSINFEGTVAEYMEFIKECGAEFVDTNVIKVLGIKGLSE